MPRKTRRQLVGKQEDIEREQLEEGLCALARELHLVQTIKSSVPYVIERAADDLPLLQAKTMLLTVHTRTDTRKK